MEDFRTPASSPPGQITHAFRSSRLANFPDFLCVQLTKFTIGADWLPRKLDVEIELDTEPQDHDSSASNTFKIDLARLRSLGGMQPGEELMPDSEEVSGECESGTFCVRFFVCSFCLFICLCACLCNVKHCTHRLRERCTGYDPGRTHPLTILSILSRRLGISNLLIISPRLFYYTFFNAGNF